MVLPTPQVQTPESAIAAPIKSPGIPNLHSRRCRTTDPGGLCSKLFSSFVFYGSRRVSLLVQHGNILDSSYRLRLEPRWGRPPIMIVWRSDVAIAVWRVRSTEYRAPRTR